MPRTVQDTLFVEKIEEWVHAFRLPDNAEMACAYYDDGLRLLRIEDVMPQAVGWQVLRDVLSIHGKHLHIEHLQIVRCSLGGPSVLSGQGQEQEQRQEVGDSGSNPATLRAFLGLLRSTRSLVSLE